MRILIGLIMGLCTALPVMAANDLVPITDLSEFSGTKSANVIKWNNQHPEQQRALNQFYGTVNQPTSPRPSRARHQHAQELRSMSPQQRQQLFLNYIKQNR